MIELKEQIRIIREHHIRRLTERRLRLLVLSYCAGLTNKQMGDFLSLTEGAVRDQMGALHDIICVPLGCDRRDSMIAAWFGFHTDCCLRATRDMIENGIG